MRVGPLHFTYLELLRAYLRDAGFGALRIVGRDDHYLIYYKRAPRAVRNAVAKFHTENGIVADRPIRLRKE